MAPTLPRTAMTFSCAVVIFKVPITNTAPASNTLPSRGSLARELAFKKEHSSPRYRNTPN
jgi:hypothetical protein